MGIASYALQSEAYTQSTFSTIVYKGAELIPYRRLSEALTNLEELVFSDRAQVAYYFLYFDKIDATGHTYGPNSDQFERMMDTFLRMMEEFYQKLAGKLEHTFLVFTLHHYPLETHPHKNFFLNQPT